MRIGICGAESTGKTTLAKALADKLELPLITEQARGVAKRLGIDDLNKDYPKRLWDRFQWECLKTQMAIEQRHESFVSDRTVLDNLAYWLVDHADPHNCYETLQYWGYAERHIRVRPYDMIVFVRPEDDIALENDGFRHTNPAHRWLIDRVLSSLVAWIAHTYSHIKIVNVSGPTNERLEQVRAGLENLRMAGIML